VSERPGKSLTHAAMSAAAPAAARKAVVRPGEIPTLAPGTAAETVAMRSKAASSGCAASATKLASQEWILILIYYMIIVKYSHLKVENP
jgi:hypothetical protein